MNEQLKPFQQVLARHDNNTYWVGDLYSHYDNNLKIHCCVGGVFSQVIPYEGNEHLLGTTDSPQPKLWRAEKNERYYFINPMLQVDMCLDVYCDDDDERYSVGNYFRTKEEAQEMADKFKAMLKGE